MVLGCDPQVHRHVARVLAKQAAQTAQQRGILGATRRTELEAEASPAQWEHAAASPLFCEDLASPPVDFLRTEAGLAGALQRVISFTNHRSLYEVELGGAPRLLELDRTRFETGEIDHELELEIDPPVIAPASEAEAMLEIKAVSAEK